MELFDFFKRETNPSEDEKKETYWSLTTILEEKIDPTMEEIETAVKNATPDQTIFATLTFNHSGLEIESVQAIGETGFYRFEALTTKGIMYVKSDLTYEETVELFREFFKNQGVAGVESWPTERY